MFPKAVRVECPGMTPHMAAAMHSSIECIKMLLYRGADPYQRREGDGLSPEEEQTAEEIALDWGYAEAARLVKPKHLCASTVRKNK